MVCCSWCNKKVQKPIGAINRAKNSGLNIYCDSYCAGLGRRKNKTEQQKKEAKRIYDEQYRDKNKALLKVKKKAYFVKTYDPEKAAEERKKNMQRHAEYCRNPEYKSYKKSYDRKYRNKRLFGEFWEAACVLLELNEEIESRATKYEIYQLNGTLNKHLNRRKDYEKLISNHS